MTIMAAHPNIRERLSASYEAWLAQGAPEYIEEWTQPFTYRVTYRDGYFCAQSWQSYRVSVRGVEGRGIKLRHDWTMKLRKNGEIGAIKGDRPDSRLCYDAVAAWEQAGKPVEFVYLN